MKKVVNIQNPDIVLIVEDAWVNGSRIICEAGTDNFDLWRSCWSIEAIDPEIVMAPSVALAKKMLTTVPPEWWERLVDDELDQVKITITKLRGGQKSLRRSP